MTESVRKSKVAGCAAAAFIVFGVPGLVGLVVAYNFGLGPALGVEFGGATVLFFGVVLPFLVIRRSKLDARLRGSLVPAIVRVDAITKSAWNRDHGPSYEVRLVRADGVNIGVHNLSPPPHLSDLIKQGARLVVQWGPSHPKIIFVDWEASATLPEQQGYRQ